MEADSKPSTEVNISGEEKKDEQGVSEGESENSSKENPILKIVNSALNIDLLPQATKNFNEVNWYRVSVTTFHIGVYSLLASSSVVLAAFLQAYLFSSPGLLSAITRTFTAGTLVPIFLAIFGVVAQWSWGRMNDVPSSKDSVLSNLESLSVGRNSSLVLTSVLSIGLALLLRVAIYESLPQSFGSSLGPGEMVTVVIIDGLYIGPMFMGIGGFATLLLETSKSGVENDKNT